MAETKLAAKVLYEDLSVYERTFIETFQALVASGNYAPGPLVMDMTRDATRALMTELGFTAPTPGVDYVQGTPKFEVWDH